MFVAGKSVYTCMLNQNAGIEADLNVSIMEPDEDVQKVLNPDRKVMLKFLRWI